MTTLILATSNVHKLAEIRQMLPSGYQIASLNEMDFKEEIAETGTTFTANALLKARTLYERFELPVVAEDSGLEVKALGGRPGIHSARYAGESASSFENISKLMKEMKGLANRKARFVAVIALIINQVEYLFEGVVDGRISDQISGSSGFGYDPVFIPDGYNGTFAELPSEVKNRISHRGKAMKKLVDFLESERSPYTGI